MVPSLEDALIAVLFNHNIQAIVVRPGLVLKSKMDHAFLQRYLNRAGGAEGNRRSAAGELRPRALPPDGEGAPGA